MTKEPVVVPLVALSLETQGMLSNLLNPMKIIATESNLPRDWRGVAELAMVPSEMMATFETKADPFKELLHFLSTKEGSIGIDDLKAFLAVIDRYDVLEDTQDLFDRDIISYVTRISEIPLDRNVTTVDSKIDSRILTFEDALRSQNGLALSRYDAFILYADEDAEFAETVIDKMEKEYSLKLCSKDRDLLPGLRFEHEVIGNMIEARCNRLLVIFSPSFLESSANQFLVSYAQAVALDTRCRKIIPCVYKRCDLPVSVRYSFCIDYNRSGKLWNFWDKLSQSLMSSKTDAISMGSKTQEAVPLKSPTQSAKTVEEDLDVWGEVSKPSKLHEENFQDTSNSVFTGNGLSHAQSIDDRFDALSIHSQAQLLPSPTSNGSKSPKWFNKLMSPIKQKKSKKKEKPIAE